MTRRAAIVVLFLALADGAGAATIGGTARPDRLVGTPRADLVLPRGAADRVDARGGDDRIALEADHARDTAVCGPGRDVVTADAGDLVAADCEVVSRAISRDSTGGPSQHESQVEPDSFAWGSTVVTVFQSGRFFDGGASEIGFSTSTDGGRTWRGGFLPGLSIYSTPAGVHARVSDPVVAYDAAHGVWLAATLAISPGLTELLVSRSPDGLRWELPVAAARSTEDSLAFDKEWLTCDTWPQSPHRGRCYFAYTDVRAARMTVQTSADGGLTWSGGAVVGQGTFATPAVQPDGGLVLVFLRRAGGTLVFVASRSSDGGSTFGPAADVATIQPVPVGPLRAPVVPSADVAADGRILLVWQDSRFRGGSANDVVLASSLDGVSWTEPQRVPAVARASAFVPAIAVEPGTARVAVLFYSFVEGAGVDAALIGSPDGGATWGPPQRLSARTMSTRWTPSTSAGRMLADYLSVSWADGRPVPVFALASEPQRNALRQAIFAGVRLG